MNKRVGVLTGLVVILTLFASFLGVMLNNSNSALAKSEAQVAQSEARVLALQTDFAKSEAQLETLKRELAGARFTALGQALTSVSDKEKANELIWQARSKATPWEQEFALAFELASAVGQDWGWNLITPQAPLSPFYTVEVKGGAVMVKLAPNSTSLYGTGRGRR